MTRLRVKGLVSVGFGIWVLFGAGVLFVSCARKSEPRAAKGERALLVPRPVLEEDLAPVVNDVETVEAVTPSEEQAVSGESENEPKDEEQSLAPQNEVGASTELQSGPRSVEVIPSLRPYLGCFETKPDVNGNRFEARITVSRTSFIIRDSQGDPVPVLVLEFTIGEGRVRRLELPLTTRTAAHAQGTLVTFSYRGDLGRIREDGETYRPVAGVQMYFVFGTDDGAQIETFAVNARILSEDGVWNERLNTVLERKACAQ